MANNILLPPQLFNLLDLTSQFPGPPFHFQKVFFQCELREITATGDVIFGVVAYPAWKRGNSPRERWVIGKKVRGLTTAPAGPNETFPVNSGNPNDPFTAFGNNEIIPWILKDEKEESGYQYQQPAQNAKFVALLNDILKDKKLAEASKMEFKARISENPHVYYDVTLSTPTSTETQSTNPCPPYSPGE